MTFHDNFIYNEVYSLKCKNNHVQNESSIDQPGNQDMWYLVSGYLRKIPSLYPHCLLQVISETKNLAWS